MKSSASNGLLWVCVIACAIAVATAVDARRKVAKSADISHLQTDIRDIQADLARMKGPVTGDLCSEECVAQPETPSSSSNTTAVVKESSKGDRVYTGGAGEHSIKKIVDFGEYITLEDGSLWRIDARDITDSMKWLPDAKIAVLESKSGSPGYDYQLINTDTRTRGRAKFIKKQ